MKKIDQLHSLILALALANINRLVRRKIMVGAVGIVVFFYLTDSAFLLFGTALQLLQLQA